MAWLTSEPNGDTFARPFYWHWGSFPHELGIYSGPSVDRYGLDNVDPELPANLARTFVEIENRLYGDFEIRRLETEREGATQANRIESARSLAAK